MSTFSQVKDVEKVTPPRDVATLPSHLYADEWPEKPEGDSFEVGLRLPSQQIYDDARARAEAHANALHPDGGPNWSDACRDMQMALVVARATCDPLDVSKPWLDAAEDNITLALRPEGIARLWQELEELRFDHGALLPEATDAECRSLAAKLLAPSSAASPRGLALLDPRLQKSVRRRLHYALLALESIEGIEEGLDVMGRARGGRGEGGEGESGTGQLDSRFANTLSITLDDTAE